MNELEKIEMLLRNRLVVLQAKVEEIEEIDEVFEGAGHAANDEIRLIKLALDRIEDGSYGECGGCGKGISKKRLEELPHAILCVVCEASFERAGRLWERTFNFPEDSSEGISPSGSH